ncbi:uncharacterized protein LOC115967604 [Quercus lobata]|uniref:uncharacterized protein LOC115967604 n=1 Tax=Quercus lobata TaxID=97700 RepID=UPI001246EDF0|nr:uncharacterized protein LOC115967604 [Quercus lobata]
MDAIAWTFKPLWREDNGFTMSNEGSYRVLFVFENKEDVDRILSSEPWSYDKSLVVLERYDRKTPLDDLKLDKASFWVQVHNIPIGYRNKSVAEDICGAIGRVDRSSSVANCEGGSYIRVRVTLDVFQPLCRGRVITFEDGGKIWINFRYERLPNICYWCGCFDHGDRDCDLWIQSKGTLNKEEQQFGSWIRAIQSGQPRKNVVRVSGFYEGRAKNFSTRRRREEQPRSRTNLTQGSNSVRNPDKENADMEADVMETQNQNSNISAKINENPNPPFQDYGNKGEYFAQKLKEIDKDLGIYEEPPSTEFFQKEASPLFDMENLRAELAINENVVLTSPREHHCHAEHAAPLRDISNYSHTPTNSEFFPQPKWKCLLRVTTGSVSSNEDHIGAKRSMNGTDDLRELPNKKLQVSHEGKENFAILAEAVVQPRQEP